MLLFTTVVMVTSLHMNKPKTRLEVETVIILIITSLLTYLIHLVVLAE